jgi:hypothetical protein
MQAAEANQCFAAAACRHPQGMPRPCARACNAARHTSLIPIPKASLSLAPTLNHPPPSLAVFHLLTSSTALRDKLEANTRYFRAKMTEAGFKIRWGRQGAAGSRSHLRHLPPFRVPTLLPSFFVPAQHILDPIAIHLTLAHLPTTTAAPLTPHPCRPSMPPPALSGRAAGPAPTPLSPSCWATPRWPRRWRRRCWSAASMWCAPPLARFPRRVAPAQPGAKGLQPWPHEGGHAPAAPEARKEAAACLSAPPTAPPPPFYPAPSEASPLPPKPCSPLHGARQTPCPPATRRSASATPSCPGARRASASSSAQRTSGRTWTRLLRRLWTSGGSSEWSADEGRVQPPVHTPSWRVRRGRRCRGMHVLWHTWGSLDRRAG